MLGLGARVGSPAVSISSLTLIEAIMYTRNSRSVILVMQIFWVICMCKGVLTSRATLSDAGLFLTFGVFGAFCVPYYYFMV